MYIVPSKLNIFTGEHCSSVEGLICDKEVDGSNPTIGLHCCCVLEQDTLSPYLQVVLVCYPGKHPYMTNKLLIRM